MPDIDNGGVKSPNNKQNYIKETIEEVPEESLYNLSGG
jgi:hypothetical protein